MQISGPNPSYTAAVLKNVSAPSGASGASDANQGEYNASIEGLAALLSMQGADIVPSNMELALHIPASASATNSVTASVTAAGGPATAAVVAQQMMDSLGSNGVLSLADVEKAENGSTSSAAGTSVDSNPDSAISADFTKLSNGSGQLTLGQLTNAIQHYMDTQNQYPNGFGSRSISQPA
jgi:hypothetical protein